MVTLLDGCLAYGNAPIWMNANTAKQRIFVKNYLGDNEKLIQLSGSDAPLRFSGLIIRRIAEEFPKAYEQTDNIQLLSSLIPAILTANSKIPTDFGNACGTSLVADMGSYL